MRSSLVSLFALAPLAAYAQSFLNFGAGALPDCARSCSAVANANAVCVPPAAPVSNQATYQSCFCQSAYLSSLYSSATTVCADVCTSASDLQQIQTWYLAQCNAAASTSAAAVSATTLSTATSTRTATTTGTAATATSTGTTTVVTGSQSSSWWSEHARWIAMVIVLIILFAGIIVLGVWLKKRHRRKANQAANMAPPVVWGPHQNQHHTDGIRYAGGGGAAEAEAGKSKGKGRAAAQEMGESSVGGGNRLRK